MRGARTSLSLTVAAALGATAAASPARTPMLAAPDGWTPWPSAPAGCAIWIPASAARLAQLEQLTWKRCPFQAEGCEALGAPWAARTGWGFGGRLSVASDGTRTFLAITRSVDATQNGRPSGTATGAPATGASARPRAPRTEGPAATSETWETVVLEDNGSRRVPIAAFRQRVPGAGCVLGSVSLTRSGDAVTAALPILREAAESAPLVVLGDPRMLAGHPERIERFGGPGGEVLAREVALRRGDVLAVWEHEGRFAVRDLATGATHRPAPGARPFRFLLEPTPVGGAVFYAAWTGDRGSVWAADLGGTSRPVLDDPVYSHDRFATDGRDAVWTRSRGLVALNTFQTVELWTGRITGGSVTSARRVMTLAGDGAALPLISIGDGWAALWHSGADVQIIRLSDGEARSLPAVAMLSWDGGSGGLVIAGGAVWARASLRGGPGNDLRLVARFALDALPVANTRAVPIAPASSATAARGEP